MKLTKKQITIEQGQYLRKKGMYLVTNNNMDKVICVTPDYDVAIKKSKNNKLWYPLTKMNWTAIDTKEALQELALGLQCSRL